MALTGPFLHVCKRADSGCLMSCSIAQIFSLGLLFTAAFRDVVSRTIPDWISIALVLVGIATRLSTGPANAAASVAAALALFILLVGIHAAGGLGGGDVKLASALAIGLPPLGTYEFVAATTFAGGGLALVYLTLRFLAKPTCGTRRNLLLRLWNVERWRTQRRGPLPYGVAIACGGTWVVLNGIGP